MIYGSKYRDTHCKYRWNIFLRRYGKQLIDRIMSENFNEEYVTPLYPNSIDGVYTSLYFSTLSLSMIVQEFEDYQLKNSNCSEWTLSSEPDDDGLQCRQE